MAGVYSRRRLVLVVALVVALLTNPLLAGALESETGGPEPESRNEAAAIGTIDILPDDTPTSTPTSTPTQTPTPTPTESTTGTATTEDGLGNVVDDVDDSVDTVVNKTSETLNDTNGTLTTVVDEADDTVNETVDNTVENTTDVVNDTIGEANETLDDTGESLENETNEVEDTLADDVTVNVTVEDAPAGETVEVDVPSTGADVAFDDLAIEVERDGGFELALTSSEDSFAAPALEGRPGTVPLGYVRLEHSIANTDVGNVTVTFGVDAERLDNANLDPEDVALYRYSEGSWHELPTELVSKEDGQYVYSAVSPGLSEFAAGAKQPSFEVPTATVETDAVTVGDEVAVRVHIENRGGADGIYTANLSFDGKVIDSRDVSVAADGSRVVTFREAVDSPGTYAVSINSVQAGEVLVQPAGTTAAPATPDAAAVPVGGQPGFGLIVASVALLATGLFALRRRD